MRSHAATLRCSPLRICGARVGAVRGRDINASADMLLLMLAPCLLCFNLSESVLSHNPLYEYPS